jgi:hypothetical protein
MSIRTTIMNTIRVLSVALVSFIWSGEGYSQCQVQKLLASDAESGDSFGFSSAIDGDWAAVGAPYESDIAVNSGAVYVFQRVGASWVETQKLKASDASFGSVFGSSVSIAGDVLVVGSPVNSPQGISGAGAAYVFERVGATWMETAKLVAGDPDPQDFLGSVLATTGNRILVSAHGDDAHGLDAGAAYVFDRIGSTWVQTGKLMGNDSVPFDGLGASVSLFGDQALVGTFNKTGPGGTRQGAAYVFEKGPTGWAQVQKLLANDGAANDFFGASCALLDTRALVGAGGRSHAGAQYGGAVYAFEKTMSGWVQTQEFWSADTGTNNLLGAFMAISGDHLVVGAPGDDDGWSSSGSAYDFRLSGSTWIEAGKLLAKDAAPDDVFGLSVAIFGNTALVGAPGVDDACVNNPTCESGAAYIFKLAPTVVQYGDCPSGAPCNNVDNHGGCRNSTNQGAVFAACGSGSVTTDDLQLEVTHCPPNKLTLLFMGPGQSTTIYGDGIRVASALNGVGVYRFGGLAADAQGMAMRGPGLVAQSQTFPPTAGHIQPGSTWNFQIWYRDPQGPCHGGTNFSNGVQVVFTP